jgi:hypothetical protein
MRCVVAGSMLALACASGASAAPARDRQSVVTFVATFVDQVNKGQSSAALGHLATDVSITEDLAPFHWRGPHAGTEWLTGMQKNGARMGVTEIRMKLGAPTQVLVHGDAAYEAIPGVVILAGKRRTLHGTGMLTFALIKDAGVWKITSLAWGGAAAK